MCATTNCLKLFSFVQNNVRNYELLKIILFCQKRDENNNLTKYSHCLTQSLREKRRATVNLRSIKKLKFMEKRMRKSKFSPNGLVRSETCRHVQICYIWAKQCAQLRIAKN